MTDVTIHTMVLEPNVLIITDNINGGELRIENHFRNRDQEEENPLVDLSNDIAQALWEDRNLLLVLFGKNRIIYSSSIGFRESVQLRDVELVNPFLRNAWLENVKINSASDTQIWNSKLINFTPVQRYNKVKVEFSFVSGVFNMPLEKPSLNLRFNHFE